MTKAGAAASPLRYFGRCTWKGCRHRRVIDESTPEPVRLRRSTVSSRTGVSEILSLVAANGRVFPLYWTGLDGGQHSAFIAAGLICPEHGGALAFRGGLFTYNGAKPCGGRCTNAIGPNCDCECGGRNHGVSHALDVQF